MTRSQLRHALLTAVIMALIVLSAYGDVAFLGFTLSPASYSYNVLVPPYGYGGRWLSGIHGYPAVMDPLATGSQNWPIYVLIGKMLSSGQLPLWNPYQGTGVPLAADPTWSTYFPFDLMHAVLSNQFWDYIWLAELWFAGIMAYLLFKRLGLSRVASIGGACSYVLSGAFTFYPFMPWTDIATMTPALLLAAKISFDKPLARKSIFVMSAAFGVSVLGAHLETLIVQSLFLSLFILFETATDRNFKGAFACLLSILLGLGFTAFYWFPVVEYLSMAVLFHPAGWGTMSFSTQGNPWIWWLTLFVPYFYGFLKTYPYKGLSTVFLWDISPGYIGTVAFFLSLVPLLSQGFDSFRRSKYYLFFTLGEAVTFMKIFGLPPVSWIGYLPVLTFVIFPRYSGSVLALSFGGSCAFGLDAVAKEVKHFWRAGVAALIALLLPVILTIPFPVSPASPFIIGSLGYLALACFYLALSMAVSHASDTSSRSLLVCLIVLELSSYIPRSLTVNFEELRVSVLAGAALLIVTTYFARPKQLVAFLHQVIPGHFSPIKPEHLAAMILIFALIAQSVVSATAPTGLPNRYNPFTVAPYVRFLEANVGYQRVYSIDGTFFPPVAGVFSIQNLGEFSSLMPSTFKAFIQDNLDQGAVVTTLVGNGYLRSDSISAVSQIYANIPFYSLLGVKYFVTTYSNLSMDFEAPSLEGLGLRTESFHVVFHDQNATIYENPEAFPRVFLTDRVITVPSEHDAVIKTKQLGWETRTTAVLEGYPMNGLPDLNATLVGSAPGVAEIEEYSPTQVRIRVDTGSPAILVLTDTFFPGWNAFQDGHYVPTYRAYGLVRAVLVEPGSHQLIFRYEPLSFQLGIYVTIASSTLIILLLCTGPRRSEKCRRRNRMLSRLKARTA